MAEPDASYIAWDGTRYAGAPPAGWYLAADNRWWPSQELIRAGDASSTAVEDVGEPSGWSPSSGAAAADDVQRGGQGVAPFEGSGSRHEGDAPATGQNGPPGSGATAADVLKGGSPGPGAGAGAGGRRRRSGRRFRPGFIIPILVFSLFRCGVGQSESEPTRPLPTFDLQSTQPPATAGLADGGFTVGDVEVTIFRCGLGTVTGEAVNLGSSTATLETILEIEPTDGTTLSSLSAGTVATAIGPLDPGATEPLMVTLTAELSAVESCKVLGISPANP